MLQAPVGWHCRQCVRKNAKKSPVMRYRPGTGALPTLGQVPVTMGLIAVCVVVYIVSQSTDLVYRWEQIGGNEYYLGQWYRLFTSIFIHYSFFHILLNMISLLIIGRLVEPVLGRWRYLALFLVAGLGGSVACYIFTGPIAQSAGASGAIFGLFGAYFVIARRARADTSGILVLIAINLFYSFVDTSISWQAHIGGLITGVVLAAALGLGRRGRHEVLIDILAVAGVCVLLGVPLLMAPGAVNVG
jgi:membrane associated rhomboid family serine protease